MASEYNLKLKATLDTSDVQKQIQRLNQQARGPQAASQGISSPSTSFARLGNTLSRLDMTLAKLTAAVQAMSKMSGMSSQALTSQVALARTLQPASMPLLHKPAYQARAAKYPYLEQLPDYFKPGAITTRDIELHGMSAFWASLQMKHASESLQKYGREAPFNQPFQNLLRESLQSQLPPRQASKLGQSQARAVASLLGLSQMHSGMQQLNQAQGYQTGPWEDMGINVAGGAMIGLTAGPAGAVLGALGGGVYTVIQQVTKYLNSLSDELKEAEEDMQRAGQFKTARKQYFRSKQLTSALEGISSGDFSAFDKLYAELEAEESSLMKRLAHQDITAKGGLVAGNALEMQSQLVAVQRMLDQLEQASSKIDEDKRQRDQQSKLQDTQRLASLQQARSRWEWQQYITAFSGDKDVLQTELAIAQRSMSTAQTAGEFSQAAGDVEALQSALESLSQNAQKNAEAIAKAFLQEDAMQRLDFFREQLSRLVRPDFSNVQSLGAYGASMGESRVDVQAQQLDYLRTQTDLQQQIKDILNDKTFSAAYS